ncbi:MAG: hypothetical protein V3V05_05605 [Pontiella sp.]
MKTAISIFCALALSSLLNGCISRTVSTGPENRGAAANNKNYGSEQNRKVTEKKIIWFWQEDFRTPQ